MKIFILENVEQLTDRWHSGGALVIVAKGIKNAKEIIKQDEYIQPTEREWEKAIIYELKDSNYKEEYYVFQDAGCC